MIIHPQEAKYGKMLTTDNLTRVDPAPGAGPDLGHGLGIVSMAEKIKFMCLTSVRVMGPSGSQLLSNITGSTHLRKTDICTLGDPECSQDPSTIVLDSN